MELLERWLVVEGDHQAVLAATETALRELGAHPLRHAPALVSASERLRAAASEGPTPARLTLVDDTLTLRADAAEEPAFSARLPATADNEAAQALRRTLAERFQPQDPQALHQRNERMAAHFEQRREAMESQLAELQRALEQRQTELAETILRAETDPLTGVYNRRAFDQHAPAAFRRTRRQGTETLCLLLIDLDDFKALNDTYGHPSGDAYLQHTATALREAVREDVDGVYRIGGDEFAILLFAPLTAACQRAFAILEAMERRVSIGIAAVDGRAGGPQTFEALHEAADESLYRAKSGGRGQVALAGCGEHPEAAGCTAPCAAVDAEGEM